MNPISLRVLSVFSLVIAGAVMPLRAQVATWNDPLPTTSDDQSWSDPANWTLVNASSMTVPGEIPGVPLQPPAPGSPPSTTGYAVVIGTLHTSSIANPIILDTSTISVSDETVSISSLTFNNTTSVAIASLGLETLVVGGAITNTTAATQELGLAVQAGANATYSGGTAGGTLQLGAVFGGSLNIATSNIALTGTVDDISTEVISGTTGTLTIGDGTIGSASTTTLSGANTFAGGTTVTNAATLILGASTVATTTIASGPVGTGTLTLNGGSTLKDNGTAITLANSASLSGTITLASTGAGSLTFDGTGLTTPATITLTGNTNLAVGNTTTIADVISGGFGLTKSGTGTLVLSGANTFTGATSVTGGTLNLSNSLALQDSTLTTGGTIVFSSTVGSHAFTLGGLSGSANLALQDNAGTPNAVALTVGGNNASTTYSGALSQGGSLTKVGSGTLTLSGTNLYIGATTITAGTLAVNGSLASGSAVSVGTAGTLSGTGTVNGNTTLTGSGAINFGAGGNIVGTLGITGGNWNGVGTVGGQVTSSSGTLTIGNGANLTATTGVNVTGGTIAAGNSSSTITGNVDYTSGSNSSFGGVIAGSAKTLTLNNAGTTLTLGGTNTYTGTTSITSGTLAVNGSTAAGSTVDVASATSALTGTGTVNGNVTVEGGTVNMTGGHVGGTLTANGGANINGTETVTGQVTSGSSAFTIGNGANLTATTGVNITGGTLVAGNSSSTITGNVNYTSASNSIFGGVIAGAGKTLILNNGAATLTLSGANTYTGATTVAQGKLNVTGSTASGSAVTIGNNTGVAILEGTGTLNGSVALATTGGNVAQLSPGTTGTAGTLHIGSLNIGGGSQLDVDLATATTVGGGVNDLVTLNAGTLTFGGQTIVDVNALGTLTTGTAYTLINGAGSIAGFNASNFTVNGLTGGETATVSDTANSLLLTINAAPVNGYYYNGGTSDFSTPGNYNTTATSGIAQTASLTSSTNVFIADNAPSNIAPVVNTNTAINSLTFTPSGSGAVVSGTGTLTISNGVTVQTGVAGTETISAPVALAGAQTWTVTDSGSTLVDSGVISGAFALSKAGSGTLTLQGVNTYSGATTVNAGVLSIGAGGSIAASSGVTLTGSGVFDISTGGGQTIQDLSSTSGSSSVTLGGNNLTLGTGNSTTFAGVISGNGGSLTKTGSGTLTLSGVNTYTGGTSIDGGAVSIAAVDTNLGTGAITLGGGEIITHDPLPDTNKNITLNTGVDTLADATGTSATYGGVISNGTGGTLIIGDSNNKGTVILAGTNTFTGFTNVADGTLQVDGSLNAGNAVTVASGSTLSGNAGGTVGGTTTVNSATVAGNGLTLDGLVTFNGTGNTLSGTEAANGGVTLASGAAVTQSGTLTGNVSLSSGAGTAFTGSGTVGGVTLNGGGDTLTGNTTLTTGGITVNSSANTIAGTVTGAITQNGGSALAVNGTATGTDTLASGATTLSGTGTVGGAVTLNGGGNTVNGTNLTVNSLAITGTGNTLTGTETATNGVTLGGTSTVSQTSGTLKGSINDTSSGTSTFAGVIANGATPASVTLNNGAGTLNFSGANTYTGATTLTAGTLILSGTGRLGATAVSIANGATLSATGTTNSVGGGITDNSGTINLQNGAINTLDGSTLAGSGTLSIDIAGTSDKIALSGAEALSGSAFTVNVDSLAGAAAGTAYTFVSAAGGLSASDFTLGTLTGTLAGDMAVFGGSGTAVTLTLTAPNGYYYTGAAADGNFNNAANYQTLASGGTVPLTNLSNATGGVNVFIGATTPAPAANPSVALSAAATINSLTFTLTGAGGSVTGIPTLTINNGVTVQTGVAGTETISAPVALGGNQTWTVASAGSTLLDSGGISGGFALTKAGAGTLTLGNTNTYTGATTISAGTLQVNGSLAGASAVTVNSGSTLAGTGTVGGTTSVNSATVNGTGLTLTGLVTFNGTNNTLSGTETATNGVAIVGTGAVAQSGMLTGSVNDTSSGTSTFAGVIADGGTPSTVTLNNAAGTLTLSGINTYTGATTLTAGTVDVTTPGTLGTGAPLNIAGGTLDLGTTNQTVGAVSITGPGTIQHGTLTGTSYSDTAASGPATISAILAGGGSLTKSGTSTLVLTNANIFSGGTTLSHGTLLVGNSTALGTAGLTQSGGNLQTTGNGGLAINVASYTQTGGTLTIQLNAAQAPGFTPNGANDVLDVAGAASISGSSALALKFNFVPVKGDTFTVVESGGGITDPLTAGYVTPIVSPAGYVVTASIVNGGDDISVDVTQTQFALTPQLGSYYTANRAAVLNYIDTNVTSGPLFTAITQALAGGTAMSATAADIADQESQEKFGNFVRSTVINNAVFSTQIWDDYIATGRSLQGDFLAGNGQIDSSALTMGAPGIDSGLAQVSSRLVAWSPAPLAHGMLSDTTIPLMTGSGDMKDMKVMTTAAPQPGHDFNVFVAGNVVLAQDFSQADLAHADTTTGAVQIGADYRITPHLRAGALFGYGHTDGDLDTNGSKATVDSYAPGAYVAFADGGWYANALGSYGFNNYTEDRALSIGGLSAVAHGAPSGDQIVGDLDGGYDFHANKLTYGPTLGVQYTHVEVDSFSEDGAEALGSDESVNQQQTDSLRSRLGGHVSYLFQTGSVLLTPHLDASWQHEFMDQSRGITSQFTGIGTGSFVVTTPSPSRDSALIDLGLNADLNRQVSVFGDYLMQAGQSNYFGQSVEAGVKIGF